MPKGREKKQKSKIGLPAPRRYSRKTKKKKIKNKKNKKAAHSLIRLLFPISTTSIRFKKGKWLGTFSDKRRQRRELYSGLQLREFPPPTISLPITPPGFLSSQPLPLPLYKDSTRDTDKKRPLQQQNLVPPPPLSLPSPFFFETTRGAIYNATAR